MVKKLAKREGAQEIKETTSEQRRTRMAHACARFGQNHNDAYVCLTQLLVAEKLDDSQLLDIIGEVVGNEDPRDIITSKGKETKRMVVVIADLDNNNLDCVLFGDMVDHILSHLEDGKVEPLIVVLLFFKPSRWNDKVSVQSHFDVSKIHVNPDMKEASGHGVQSGAVELKRRGVVVKSIEDALNSTEEGPIGIGGTIVSINVGNNDSFYKSLFGRRRLPPTLDNMMDKKLLFKLNVKIANINKHDQVYTIMKICDDEDIVEKNCPIEFISNPSDVLTENGISNSLDVSATVANLKSDNNS
ncbi:replication protein A 70 kDa DNA-binding subunit A-like [Arachis hypogaea]|nr:replication protein A 70 kDa DNA-binding subunit A-like [Arachis hypogaea]